MFGLSRVLFGRFVLRTCRCRQFIQEELAWDIKQKYSGSSQIDLFVIVVGLQGIGLRFPRFVRARNDKKPGQATTNIQVRVLQCVLSKGSQEQIDSFDYWYIDDLCELYRFSKCITVNLLKAKAVQNCLSPLMRKTLKMIKRSRFFKYLT